MLGRPEFDIDLYLSTDLRTMTEIWMGYTPIARAKERRPARLARRDGGRAVVWPAQDRAARVDPSQCWPYQAVIGVHQAREGGVQ